MKDGVDDNMHGATSVHVIQFLSGDLASTRLGRRDLVMGPLDDVMWLSLS